MVISAGLCCFARFSQSSQMAQARLSTPSAALCLLSVFVQHWAWLAVLLLLRVDTFLNVLLRRTISRDLCAFNLPDELDCGQIIDGTLDVIRVLQLQSLVVVGKREDNFPLVRDREDCLVAQHFPATVLKNQGRHVQVAPDGSVDQ